MRKIWAYILMLVMVMSFCSVVFADGNEDEKEEEPTRSSYASTTVTDNGNNRYLVQGGCVYYGTTGDVYTYFKNTYVYNGLPATQQSIYNGVKTLGAHGAHGNVLFSGGGSETDLLGQINHAVAYTLESTYNPTYTYINTIVYIAAQHVFSYNGAYWSVSTTYPY